MKPPKILQTSLTAIMIAVFMIAPFNSRESISKNKKNSFNTHLQVVDEGASKQAGNIDFSIPDPKKKEKDNRRHDDYPRVRRHADEEKHKNHLYHYQRVRTRNKVHTVIICVLLKVFIAISYLAVLLCGYMSIGH
jgi:hypothetical protein